MKFYRYIMDNIVFNLLLFVLIFMLFIMVQSIGFISTTFIGLFTGTYCSFFSFHPFVHGVMQITVFTLYAYFFKKKIESTNEYCKTAQ